MNLIGTKMAGADQICDALPGIGGDQGKCFSGVRRTIVKSGRTWAWISIMKRANFP
jgi:hypothetical protein